METRFKTNSFIPKSSLDSSVDEKGVIQRSSGSSSSFGSSFFIIISFLFFLVSLVSAGMVFSLNKLSLINKDSAIESLKKSQKDIDKTTIEELKELNSRLSVINNVVENHTMVSNIFDELAKFTLKEVSYSSFSLNKNNDKSFTLALSAEGIGYESIIAQDNLFLSAESQKFFKNTSIKNFSKSKGQSIARFNVEATVSKNSTNLSEILKNKSNINNQ